MAALAVTSLVPPSATAEMSRAIVTVAGPRSDPMTGVSFAISGTVSSSISGQAVRLQREVDGRFRRVATAAVSAGGSYLFSRIQKVGSYVYRVKVPRSESAAAAISATVSVFVTTHFIRRAVVRAQSWVDAHVPYSQSSTHTNRYGTYRQDCSGYVSLAWALPSSYTTATLPSVSFAISQTDLRRGDLLLHLATHKISGHVVMFDTWADAAHTSFVAYEDTPSGGAIHHVIPYPYWSGYGSYVPYRRDGT